MRHILVLAAMLALGIPVYGQQDQQPAHPQPIPSNPFDWHVHGGPIPSNPFDWHVYAGPIPNWPFPSESELGWHAFAMQLRPCAVFQPDGKKYRYVEGPLPDRIKRKKRFTDAELKEIKEKGGDFKILNSGSSKNEMDAALDACLESSLKTQH